MRLRSLGHRIQLALGAAAALAAISLSPGSAQAYVVTVGGVQYDVTTFTGTFNDNISKFATPANGGVMPWWGSDSLAETFASQVGLGLGLPNYGATHGPLFAWRFRLQDAVDNCYLLYYGSTGCGIANTPNTHTYAEVTPVPGPLPLFGAALPLGFCRRLSRRSKRLRHGVTSRRA